MTSRNAQAGGVFLTIGVVGGAGVGIAMGNPMAGVLAGSALGAATALLLWLRDLCAR